MEVANWTTEILWNCSHKEHTNKNKNAELMGKLTKEVTYNQQIHNS